MLGLKTTQMHLCVRRDDVSPTAFFEDLEILVIQT